LFGPTNVKDLIRRVEDHLTWARSTGDLITEARALGALGQARAMQGEFDTARDLIDKEQRLIEELGSKLRVAWTAFEASAVEMLAGDPEQAERELLSAYEFLEQMGEKATLSTLAAILAEVKYQQEDFEEAERLTLVSSEASTEDDFLSQMAWRSTRAKLLARKGEFEAAEKLSREAIAIATRTDFVDTHAAVMMDLAEVLRLAGRIEEAPEAAAEALRLYEGKGNSVFAERARKLIDELTAAVSG
jgi:ATP/maltotriose-dependent transcriptional regulator MalT